MKTDEKKIKEDQAFDRMLRSAYGCRPADYKEPALERLTRWSKKKPLEIGKEMYGTILLADAAKEREAYVRGLCHGMELQKFIHENEQH